MAGFATLDHMLGIQLMGAQPFDPSNWTPEPPVTVGTWTPEDPKPPENWTPEQPR